MPGELDHKNHALHNKSFFDNIWSDSNFPDWVVIVGFYTALHCVDAVLARDGLHPQKHTMEDPKEFAIARNELVSTHRLTSPVARAYIQLYQWSRNARYNPSFLFLLDRSKIIEKVKNYLETKFLPLIQ